MSTFDVIKCYLFICITRSVHVSQSFSQWRTYQWSRLLHATDVSIIAMQVFFCYMCMMWETKAGLSIFIWKSTNGVSMLNLLGSTLCSFFCYFDFHMGESARIQVQCCRKGGIHFITQLNAENSIIIKLILVHRKSQNYSFLFL